MDYISNNTTSIAVDNNQNSQLRWSMVSSTDKKPEEMVSGMEGTIIDGMSLTLLMAGIS